MHIELKHIAKRYRGVQVLRDVNLTARSGQCIGILGSNGSGKSTLLSILAGVQDCQGGSFLFDGHDLFADPARRSALVGYVPQGTPLMEELSARDNLLLWYDKKALDQELQGGVLAMLGIGEFLHRPVAKLSGGMKKRLSIGCAMAKRPPILLLDEPAAALDLACKQAIVAYLRRYKRSGGILLLTTHDIMELELCDAWYILKDGVLEPFDYDGDVQRLVSKL
ncbi:MAG: ABC transporter ATP-binding protein [Oscillospiraceae bacterium]|nr:ABC transporter ATP-binding protein [Oscillospiraceae bacterium]